MKRSDPRLFTAPSLYLRRSLKSKFSMNLQSPTPRTKNAIYIPVSAQFLSYAISRNYNISSFETTARE